MTARGWDGADSDRGDVDPDGRQDREEVPLLQWIVSGVAAVIVLASFGLIAYDGFVGRRGPAAVSIAIDSVARAGDLYRVHVSVRNEGGSAASDVQVRGQLANGASPATTILLDYLPAGSSEAAVFVFPRDPTLAGLHLSVESWLEP